MSESFFKFSVFIPLPSKKAVKSAVKLLETVRHVDEDDTDQLEKLPKSFWEDEDVLNQFDCFKFEEDDDGIFITSIYGGHPAAAAFIQHILQQYYPNDYFTFQWSTDSSRVDTNVYCGGAYLITATEIKSFDTGDWINQNTKNMKGKRIGAG